MRNKNLKWAVLNRYGYAFGFHDTRKESIEEALEATGEETWRIAKRKFGFKVIRVEFSKVRK